MKKSRIEYPKKWKKDNAEKVRAYKRKWNRANTDYNKKYRKDHKEELAAK